MKSILSVLVACALAIAIANPPSNHAIRTLRQMQQATSDKNLSGFGANLAQDVAGTIVGSVVSMDYTDRSGIVGIWSDFFNNTGPIELTLIEVLGGGNSAAAAWTNTGFLMHPTSAYSALTYGVAHLNSDGKLDRYNEYADQVNQPNRTEMLSVITAFDESMCAGNTNNTIALFAEDSQFYLATPGGSIRADRAEITSFFSSWQSSLIPGNCWHWSSHAAVAGNVAMRIRHSLWKNNTGTETIERALDVYTFAAPQPGSSPSSWLLSKWDSYSYRKF